MKKNKFTKIIIIILLSIVVCAGVFLLATGSFDTNRPKEAYDGIYQEPENSLDGIMIGSSALYRYWIAAQAFEDYGMAVYPYANIGFPYFFYKQAMEEVLKYQNPKFVCIELRPFIKYYYNYHTNHTRRITNFMPSSWNRLDMILETIERKFTGEVSTSRNPLRYHYMSIEKSIERATETKARKRFPIDQYSFMVEAIDIPKISGKKSAPPKASVDYLEYFLTYCQNQDCEVIFLISPWSTSDLKIEMTTYVKDEIEKAGFTVIDCSTKEAIKKMKLNEKKDFYSTRHVNLYGARKYTTYVAKKLQKMYDFEDHRADPKYASWTKAAKQLKADIKKATKEYRKQK